MVEGEQGSAVLSVEEEAGGRGHRTRLLILGVVVALSVGYMIYAAFPGNTLFFLTVSEFMSQERYQDGSTVRVAGTLVEGSFQTPEKSTVSHFRLVDKDGGTGSESLNASYVGVLPDLFFNPHSEIILQGRQGPDSVFEADNILVKCPSKYRSLEEELQGENAGT